MLVLWQLEPEGTWRTKLTKLGIQSERTHMFGLMILLANDYGGIWKNRDKHKKSRERCRYHIIYRVLMLLLFKKSSFKRKIEKGKSIYQDLSCVLSRNTCPQIQVETWQSPVFSQCFHLQRNWRSKEWQYHVSIWENVTVCRNIPISIVLDVRSCSMLEVSALCETHVCDHVELACR